MQKRVLIATDSHKDIASSAEAGEWIAAGIRQASPDIAVEVMQVADGGEGTIDALIAACGGSVLHCEVHNPLFQPRRARFGVLADAEQTGVMEIAEASGSAILEPAQRDTMVATSYGTGEIILSAVASGCKRLVVGLGGSIVSDGGMGMAQALGARFLAKDGQELRPERNGGFNVLSLDKIGQIDLSGMPGWISEVPVIIAADVHTRLLGPHGQASTFGPQKGATAEQIEFIEKGLVTWSSRLSEVFGIDVDIPYAGAAGGLGAGLRAFLGGELRCGIDFILEETGFHQLLGEVDIVITGEGKLDKTSLLGKASTEIGRIAQQAGKPVLGVFGRVDLDADITMDSFTGIMEATPRSMNRKGINSTQCRGYMLAAGERAAEWINNI